MSVSSPCEICAMRSVRHTCTRCGQLVCDRHFDEETGLCVECASDVGRPGDRSPDPGRNPDGVDTYRF
ncbi:hypothetical protein BRC83_09565 [Halobacteriales archaeon QS_1_68_17]|jgi:hypothetical protein|nr:MAG: hypothetical protein BRC83_09565 [Halobacteriales archaeon QS_1_68_17]